MAVSATPAVATLPHTGGSRLPFSSKPTGGVLKHQPQVSNAGALHGKRHGVGEAAVPFALISTGVDCAESTWR